MTSIDSFTHNLPNGRPGGIDPGVEVWEELPAVPSPPLGGVSEGPLLLQIATALVPIVLVGYFMAQNRAPHSTIDVIGGVGLLVASGVFSLVAVAKHDSRRPFLILTALQTVTALALWRWWPASLAWIELIWGAARLGNWLPWRQAVASLIATYLLFFGVAATFGLRVFDLGLSWPSVFFTAVFVIGVQRRARQAYLRQIEQMVVALRRSNEQLADAHRQLQIDALQAAALAAAEERNRIAQEIHDVLAHSLTVIVVQAQAIKRLIASDPRLAAEQTDQLANLARDGLQEARRSVAALRSQPTGSDGLSTLRKLVEEFGQHTGSDVHFVVHGEGKALSANAWTTLYRVTQEALTNARRHGQAQQIDVQLSLGEPVRLTVDDNGEAKPDGSVVAGNGLIGMGERAQRLGGVVAYRPRPEGGFHVELELPA